MNLTILDTLYTCHQPRKDEEEKRGEGMKGEEEEEEGENETKREG